MAETGEPVEGVNAADEITEAEAEIILREHGIDPGQIANEFIERLAQIIRQQEVELTALRADIAARSEGEAAVILNEEQRSRFGEAAWETAQLLANHYCSEEDTFVAETERLAKGICALADRASAPATDEVERACWHCGVLLRPAPKPRCENCPDECDENNCDAMGCRPRVAS